MTRSVSLQKTISLESRRVRRTLTCPEIARQRASGLSQGRGGRAARRKGGREGERGENSDPGGLSSSITYKRFKRSECQLVNIIIMTSNMARSLHHVTRPALETGIRLTHGPDNCSPGGRATPSTSHVLRSDQQMPGCRIGMFCPHDLFRLKELMCPVRINNLTAASSRCHRAVSGAKSAGGATMGGRRSCQFVT